MENTSMYDHHQIVDLSIITTISIVLLAVVDANYKFIYINVGCNGRVSDGGVFRQSSIFTALENNLLNIPPPEPLPGSSLPVPYTLVADSAFPLKNYNYSETV